MREIRTHACPSEYWAAVGPELLSDEPLHSLAIGLAQRFIRDGWEPEAEDAPVGSILASVWHDDGRFDLGAWCGPPHSLSVTGGSAEGLVALMALVRERNGPPQACYGPAESVERIAKSEGRSFDVEMDQALFRLDAVITPESVPTVEVVVATEEHRALVGRWCLGFAVDAGLATEDGALPLGAPPLKSGELYLALGPGREPVSMAAITRETPGSANISWVYTPEDRRGRGYASAIVAQLSQQTLDRGKSFCTLYTDMANPTSNKIYQAIGYRRIGAFRHIRFQG